MSEIRKQGLSNTIISYAGAAIGVVNLIFLYPFFFQTEEIGLIRILGSVSLMYAHLASFGLNSVILRFSPHFNRPDSGFAFGALIYAIIGFAIATLMLFALKPVIVPIYISNSPLLVEYYNWLVPLSLFVLIFNVLESFLRMGFKTRFSLFCREVLLRLLTLAGILAVAAENIRFEQFMIWFLLIHSVAVVPIFIQALRVDVDRFRFFSLKPAASFFRKRRFGRVFRYGLISLLTGATTYLVHMLDAVMIGAYLDLEQVGIYTIAFFMGSVIAMPARGIARISVPLVANAWKSNDVASIEAIYKTTSFIQFSVGALVFGGILVNLQDVFRFLPETFSTGLWVVFWIGLGHWIDMTGGINSNILNTSRKYDMDLYFNVFFIVVCVIANVSLIPLYGLNGAALASALSFLSVNAIRSGYLWYAFGMHPFSVGYLRILSILSVGIVPFFYVQFTAWHPLPAIVVKSTLLLATLFVLFRLTGQHKALEDAIRQMK